MPAKAKTSQADLDLLMQLMRIPGKSGEETEVAELITERLVKAGADPRWIVQDCAHRSTPIKGRCGNLILKSPARDSHGVYWSPTWIPCRFVSERSPFARET